MQRQKTGKGWFYTCFVKRVEHKALIAFGTNTFQHFNPNFLTIQKLMNINF